MRGRQEFFKALLSHWLAEELSLGTRCQNKVALTSGSLGVKCLSYSDSQDPPFFWYPDTWKMFRIDWDCLGNVPLCRPIVDVLYCSSVGIHGTYCAVQVSQELLDTCGLQLRLSAGLKREGLICTWYCGKSEKWAVCVYYNEVEVAYRQQVTTLYFHQGKLHRDSGRN